MKRGLLLSIVFLAGMAHGEVPSSLPETPFKLATFEASGAVRVGLVVGDTILDIHGANQALTSAESLSQMEIPNEMRALIESYSETKTRLYQIANYYTGKNLGGQSFAFTFADVSLKAPIKYPYNMMAAAANYQDHSAEMARRYGNPEPKPVDPDQGLADVFREIAALVHHRPRSRISDAPRQRKKRSTGRTSSPSSLGTPATRLTLDNAADHVFGYSIVFDVSTRDSGEEEEEEEEGGWSFGVNWFEAKSRDNAAPFGPVIVPKEFIADSARTSV